MKRALGVAAILLGVAAMSVGSAGLAAAQGPGGKGHTGGAPPGNNGTVKIDQTVLVDGGKVDHANHPHVSCTFALSFFGFDVGTDWATVAFTAQPPSGTFQSVAAIPPMYHFPFTGHGPGGSFDISVPYQLNVSGLKANVNQGYHIKVDVEVTGSIGSDDKYKVFWYEPCQAPTTTLGTTTTTVKHGTTTTTTVKHGSTTTSSTLTPTSSTTPDEGTTTSTTVKHGTTTTSTTLTPTSSTAPEISTTSTSTSIPPTTVGHEGQTGTTTTIAPARGAGPGQTTAPPGAAGSPSGLTFTNGPTPSGAGTDLGFFSPGGSSHLPWLLLIIGGILLSGAGTFSLSGNRMRKWISRA